MVCDRLASAGFACRVCANLEELAAAVAEGAGAVILAQEALSPEAGPRLLALLEAQEPWSDVPVLLLTELTTTKRGQAYAALGLFENANVTLLPRPLSQQLLLSSVRSALRARRRQYRMRDLHEELVKAVQLSEMFVSILGHDLRTPLGAIRLSAETILRGAREPLALRPAGRILSSADRMARLIEQILDFARLRQGRGIPLNPKAANLAELCRHVVGELEDANPQAEIQLQSTGDLSGVWDPDRLSQVVSNLAGNAVKHGASGEPITLALDGTGATTVSLRIENAGTIPADALPTLFEAFKQPTTRSKTERTGLGLGLYIAREIARAHGGDITVASSHGRTTFEVKLPREPLADGARTPAPSK